MPPRAGRRSRSRRRPGRSARRDPIDRWPTAGHVEPATRHDGSAPGGERPDEPEQEPDGLGIETLHVVDQEAHRLGTALQRGRRSASGVPRGRPVPGHRRCRSSPPGAPPRRPGRAARSGAGRSVDGDDRLLPPRTTRRAGGRTSTFRTRREPRPGRGCLMPARPLDESVAPHHDVPERGLRQTRHQRSLRDVARTGARAIACRMLVGRHTRTFPPSGGRTAGLTTSRRRNNAWTHRRTRATARRARGGSPR